jgi:hypothetical protein
VRARQGGSARRERGVWARRVCRFSTVLLSFLACSCLVLLFARAVSVCRCRPAESVVCVLCMCGAERGCRGRVPLGVPVPLVRRGDYFEAGMWNGARCEGLLHVSRA